MFERSVVPGRMPDLADALDRGCGRRSGGAPRRPAAIVTRSRVCRRGQRRSTANATQAVKRSTALMPAQPRRPGSGRRCSRSARPTRAESRPPPSASRRDRPSARRDSGSSRRSPIAPASASASPGGIRTPHSPSPSSSGSPPTAARDRRQPSTHVLHDRKWSALELRGAAATSNAGSTAWTSSRYPARVTDSPTPALRSTPRAARAPGPHR